MKIICLILFFKARLTSHIVSQSLILLQISHFVIAYVLCTILSPNDNTLLSESSMFLNFDSSFFLDFVLLGFNIWYFSAIILMLVISLILSFLVENHSEIKSLSVTIYWPHSWIVFLSSILFSFYFPLENHTLRINYYLHGNFPISYSIVLSYPLISLQNIYTGERTSTFSELICDGNIH